MCVWLSITYNRDKDQQGKVANPARGPLNRGKYFSLSPSMPEKFVS